MGFHPRLRDPTFLVLYLLPSSPMGHLHCEYFLRLRVGDRCVPELLRVIQVGTSLPRTGALRDVECRDQPAKTPLLQVSETLQNRNRASDAAADQDLPVFASGHTRRVVYLCISSVLPSSRVWVRFGCLRGTIHQRWLVRARGDRAIFE